MFVSAKGGAIVGAICVASMLVAAPGQAQTPTVTGVISVCAPVIDEEYKGDKSRYGTCVAEVKAYVAAIGAPSDPTNQQVADLAVELAKLYQDLKDCITPDTELPEALDVAAAASSDQQQRAQIIEVRATIYSCDVGTTAAIGLDSVSDEPSGASPF